MNWILSLTFALASLTAHAKTHHHRAAKSKPFPSKVHLTKVGSCDVADATKKVMVLKQWHLAPTTITKGFKEKNPQEKNQTAIYKVLDEGVKRGELQLVVSEGCEGDIDENFKPAFNGWDYASLKAQSRQRNYDKIITLVPLKVAAKYGDKIKVLCGDDDKLIQDGNLHLSNLRGWMGFFERLGESGLDAEKLKLYSESAAELLKVPKNTTADKLLPLIKQEIHQDLDDFFKSLADRNAAFVKVLSDQDYTRAAIVVGGLHASDLQAKLEKAGIGCDIYEPPGYQRDNEKLIQEFKNAE